MLTIKIALRLGAMFCVAGFGILACFTIYRFAPTSKFGESVCEGAVYLVDLLGRSIKRIEDAYGV